MKLRSFVKTFVFMWLNMRIYKHARSMQGYYAGGISAKWWSGHFYTYTVWEDRESLLRFVHTGPHSSAKARMEEFMGPGSCYAEFESSDPPDWDQAEKRLMQPTRYFVPPNIGDSAL